MHRKKNTTHRQTSSNRQLKVASLINAALIDAIRRGRMIDIRLIDVPVTFTRVSITADLRIANCYYIPFNTSVAVAVLQEALESSKYSLRHYITEQLRLKFSPELRFHYETGIDNAKKVEQILNSI